MNEEIQEQALKVYNEVKAIKVVDPVSYQVAGENLKKIKAVRKSLTGFFKPMIDKAKESLNTIKEQYATYDDPLEEAEGAHKKAIGDYDYKQKQLAIQEQARLQEEARKEAEERQLAKAQQLEAQGHTEAAEQVLNKPVFVPKVSIAPEAKVSGISSYEQWSAEVFDLQALAKAVCEGKAPITFISANMVALNQMARAQKDAMNIPGVKAVSETVVKARSK